MSASSADSGAASNSNAHHPQDAPAQKSYENNVRVLLIDANSDANHAANTAPLPRGRYRIPTKLYEAMRTYLDPHSQWGFVVCCIGAYDSTNVEEHIERVESHMDRFSMGLDQPPESGQDVDHGSGAEIQPGGDYEALEDAVDMRRSETEFMTPNEEAEDYDVAAQNTVGTHRRGTGSTTSSQEHDNDDIIVKERGKTELQRRKMPGRKCKTSRNDQIPKPNGGISSDTGSEFEITRERKRRKRHDALVQALQQAQEVLSDSALSSEDDFEAGTHAARRTEKPKMVVSSKGRLRREFVPQAQKKPRPTRKPGQHVTRLPAWPAAMMSISEHEDHPHGIRSEWAIKMVEKKAKAKGLYGSNWYGAFAAEFFTPASMENLMYVCQRYDSNEAVYRMLDRSDARKRVRTEVDGVPPGIKQLLEAYIEAATRKSGESVVIADTLYYQRQIAFSQRLDEVYSQINAESGEDGQFIIQRAKEDPWHFAPARTYTRAISWIDWFLIEHTTGKVMKNLSRYEKSRLHTSFARLAKSGRNMQVLSTVCTPAMLLLVAAMSGWTHTSLQQHLKPEDLRDFVSEILEMVPEYRSCFRELERNIWIPMMSGQNLPPSRLLRLKLPYYLVREEIAKESVLYWLQADTVGSKGKKVSRDEQSDSDVVQEASSDEDDLEIKKEEVPQDEQSDSEVAQEASSDEL